MKYLLLVLTVASLVSCSKKNEAAEQKESKNYFIQVVAIDDRTGNETKTEVVMIKL